MRLLVTDRSCFEWGKLRPAHRPQRCALPSHGRLTRDSAGSARDGRRRRAAVRPARSGGWQAAEGCRGRVNAKMGPPKGRRHDQTDTIGESLGCFPRFPDACGRFEPADRFFSRFGASSTRSLASGPRSEPPRGRAPGAQPVWMRSGNASPQGTRTRTYTPSVWCANMFWSFGEA
eukprot:gene24758-biopygen19447